MKEEGKRREALLQSSGFSRPMTMVAPWRRRGDDHAKLQDLQVAVEGTAYINSH